MEAIQSINAFAPSTTANETGIDEVKQEVMHGLKIGGVIFGLGIASYATLALACPHLNQAASSQMSLALPWLLAYFFAPAGMLAYCRTNIPMSTKQLLWTCVGLGAVATGSFMCLI